MYTWIKLKSLLREVESGAEYSELDSISQRLLEWIAVRNLTGTPLYVQEIVIKSEVASPATVHKSIAILEDYGLITLRMDHEDSRRRIVKISLQAERLLSKLSRGVEVWASAQAKGR